MKNTTYYEDVLIEFSICFEITTRKHAELIVAFASEQIYEVLGKIGKTDHFSSVFYLLKMPYAFIRCRIWKWHKNPMGNLNKGFGDFFYA